MCDDQNGVEHLKSPASWLLMVAGKQEMSPGTAVTDPQVHDHRYPMNNSDQMAANIKEINKNMANYLLLVISQTSQNLRMMEVSDHFELLQELGTGAYGKVVMGKHKHSDQMVALKMLAKEKTPADDFILEYSISLTFSCHPHIIRTHQMVFHTRRDFMFAQEVAPAGNLQSLIKRKVGMQEDMVKRCVPQIASALDFMHNRGLVHRDIKANNILLMDPECHSIKLSDFGLTRLRGSNIPSVSCYKPHMAPELCALKEGKHLLVLPSLDVWAFGILVYFALTGIFPWHGAVGSDQKYRAFVWWQLEKDPSNAPKKWKKVSVGAREMFWELLAPNASERCSAMDILRYIHLPWKSEVSSEHRTSDASVL
ncbi:serine/threonine-protein kinase SBK1-like [Eleutherodactylus coqui]|uniref:serine/threonine-protein kinase SBK1-like n=1 Tax=Eleutherodactylus coqui TaxID=57060 RepID=UPI003461E6C7